jgi:hypothetical protein
VQNKFNKNLSFSSTAVETLQAAAKLPEMYASEREVKYKNASCGWRASAACYIYWPLFTSRRARQKCKNRLEQTRDMNT